MENVRIIDLKVDNIVQFQPDFKNIKAMQTAIVNRVYEDKGLKTFWKAEVENQAGYKFTLTDNDDFVRVEEPFTRKIKYSGDTEMEIDVVDKITGAKFTTDVKEQEVDIPSNTSFIKKNKTATSPIIIKVVKI